MTTKRISLPLSRARREFRKLVGCIDRGEVDVYEITRHGIPRCEIIKHRTGEGVWDSFFKEGPGVSPDFSRSQEDDDWLKDPPVGREEI
ncbi:hypothetical protein [Litorivivens sp.]|uniref:hypothetical protein n=1 Tax=Litorivivens sp. TaxID=2020868 RepID=UPI003567D9F7